MDLKRIKEIMTAMRRSRTRRLRIKEKDYEIELEMGDIPETKLTPTAEQLAAALQVQAQSAAPKDIPQSLNIPEEKKEEMEVEESGQFVTSPMVGTFYSSPSPDEPHFVKEGDSVKDETVVCIIEAMKVMNEVKANISGRIAEVLVENGHPVEFGTKLFRITS